MDEPAVRALFAKLLQEAMAGHVENPTTHYSIEQVRDHLPDLNLRLRIVVAEIADARIKAAGSTAGTGLKRGDKVTLE